MKRTEELHNQHKARERETPRRRRRMPSRTSLRACTSRPQKVCVCVCSFTDSGQRVFCQLREFIARFRARSLCLVL